MWKLYQWIHEILSDNKHASCVLLLFQLLWFNQFNFPCPLLHNCNFSIIGMKHNIVFNYCYKMSDFYPTVKEVCLAPIHKGAGKGKNCLPEHHWRKHNGKNYAARWFLYSSLTHQCLIGPKWMSLSRSNKSKINYKTKFCNTVWT